MNHQSTHSMFSITLVLVSPQNEGEEQNSDTGFDTAQKRYTTKADSNDRNDDNNDDEEGDDDSDKDDDFGDSDEQTENIGDDYRKENVVNEESDDDDEKEDDDNGSDKEHGKGKTLTGAVVA